MTDPVPAPEEQGEPVCPGRAHVGSYPHAYGKPPDDRCWWCNAPRPAPVEQGETVCPCLAGADDPIHIDRSLEHYHPYPEPVCSAPPSSEEAEARAALFDAIEDLFARLPTPGGYSGQQVPVLPPFYVERVDAYEAAIRSPLEERVRALEEDILAMLDGPSIDEWMSRAKALEERVRELDRAEAAEAQAAKLREALEQIAAMRGGDVVLLRDQMRRVAALALAAETVQEGGETQ